MSYFTIMNEKMDNGWKMTDYSCKVCRNNTLIDDSKTQFFCCKCNKEVDYEKSEGQSDDEKEPQQNNQNIEPKNLDSDSDDYVYQKPVQNAKNDQNLKTLGDKLLQGWTMLAASCDSCLVPLMRNKQNETLCVCCNTETSKPQKEEQKKTQIIESKNKIQTTQIPFNQPKLQPPMTRPTPQISNNTAQKSTQQAVNLNCDNLEEKFQNQQYEILLNIQQIYQSKLEKMDSVLEIDQFVQGPLTNLINLQQKFKQ